MSELNKLRLKLAQLEEQLALARGDSCRANYRLEKLVELQSGCLKAIAQLTLGNVFSPRSCKCVRGIGLNGAELGYVKDCPIHGEGTRHWHNSDYGIAYDCEAD